MLKSCIPTAGSVLWYDRIQQMKRLFRIFLWALAVFSAFNLVIDIGFLLNWWATGEQPHPELLEHWPWNLIVLSVLIYILNKGYEKQK